MTMPGMAIVRHRDFDATEAEAITDQIRSSMGDLMILVSKAWHGRVWIALGYESWPDYIKGEFDHAPMALPPDERRAVSVLLRGQGMSTRAIAPAVGVHHDTVASDLSPVGNPTPEFEAVPITGLDGKTYQPKPPVPQPDTAPSKPRRGPITDDAGRIGRDLASITRRLNKMLDDDRFSRNREQIGNQIRPHPQHCLDALERLIQQIDGRD
jgi:hypothetical protein